MSLYIKEANESRKKKKKVLAKNEEEEKEEEIDLEKQTSGDQ